MIRNISKILLILIFVTTNASGKDNENLYKKIDLFGEVLDKVKKEYVDEINESDVMDAAINGVLQSLDPYSVYMNPELFESMQTDTKGEFGGLGIEVGMEAGVVKVISPIDDTPASKAGIKAGDYIIKINDVQVQGKTLMEAVKLMRGPVGSPIDLTIRRKGEKKIISKTFLKKSSINTEFLIFAKSLRANGHSIGILSNLTPETSINVQKHLLKEFDYHFYSNLLKMSKPNPEIYEHVCDQISSQNIIFIDDKQENLDTAKLFDIETILFTSDDYQFGLIEQKILNFFPNHGKMRRLKSYCNEN